MEEDNGVKPRARSNSARVLLFDEPQITILQRPKCTTAITTTKPIHLPGTFIIHEFVYRSYHTNMYMLWLVINIQQVIRAFDTENITLVFVYFDFSLIQSLFFLFFFIEEGEGIILMYIYTYMNRRIHAVMWIFLMTYDCLFND